MRVYYDRDADVNLIKGKKVLVVGYGSQGHAHAMNLRDSGVKDVRIALKLGSATIKKAEAVGFTVMSPAEGAKWADIIMVLAPDELQGDIYTNDLGPNMKPGAALAFAHGLNVHFNLISPRSDIFLRMALNEAWLTLFSSIQSRAKRPDWMSASTRFISALVSSVTMRGPERYSPYSAVLEIE